MAELLVLAARPKVTRGDAHLWGSSVAVESGAERFVWQASGVALSRRYRARRAAEIVTTDGSRCAVTIDGVGGVKTSPSLRHRGHATAMLRASLQRSQSDHFHLAMLFCREDLVAWYARQGWIMRSNLAITCRGAVISMARLHVGLWPLSLPCPMSAIAGIETEGCAW